jgi:hypothetical protein
MSKSPAPTPHFLIALALLGGLVLGAGFTWQSTLRAQLPTFVEDEGAEGGFVEGEIGGDGVFGGGGVDGGGEAAGGMGGGGGFGGGGDLCDSIPACTCTCFADEPVEGGIVPGKVQGIACDEWSLDHCAEMSDKPCIIPAQDQVIYGTLTCNVGLIPR